MKKDRQHQKNDNIFHGMKIVGLNEVLIIDTIMNNSHDTVYFKDLNSNFILNSKAHALLFGLDDPREMIGKSDFDFFPKCFAQNAYNDEQKIISTGEPIVGRIEKWIQEDGNIIWFSASKYPLYDSEGNIIGTWGTSRDITTLKKAEEELVQLNAQLEEANRQLTILSAIDSLSGLYNHRHFYEQLTKAFKLYTRQKEKGKWNTSSIILFDIDDFKTTNDTYGHLMGDVVIRHIAEIMKANTRSTDSCFRYGGDEFAILLLDTNIEEAREVAEKIRKIIEKTPISAKYTDLQITVSVGVSYFDEAENINDLIQKADKRLYRSKHEGKNKTN